MPAKFTAVLFVQVEPPMLDDLDNLARLRGTTRSHEVRASVRERLARFGPADQLARDSAFLAEAQERASAGDPA